MRAWTFAAAADIRPQELHAAFGAAFSDYLAGPFRIGLQQWPQFLARQGVDLARSRVCLRRGRALAFALVAPRADIAHWRLASMGALPQARGTGAAPALLDDFIARAGAAGMAGVELECFEQNERALRLYRGRGFEPLHALYGYTRGGDALPGAGAAGDHAVPLDDACKWIDAFSRDHHDLPFQITSPALRALPLQLQAWRHGTAQLVVSQALAGTLNVQSLIDSRPRQDDAQALVAAVLAQHPSHRMNVPQLQRLDLGGLALERLGFERQALNQLLLRRPLD
jgi:ribosomal protein S18 acetylase RimI-like enzyme